MTHNEMRDLHIRMGSAVTEITFANPFGDGSITLTVASDYPPDKLTELIADLHSAPAPGAGGGTR